MLCVQDLSVDFNGQRIFENVNFELHAGQLLHIQGANGSGKSTLLKTLAGLIEPSHGQVLFSGQSIEQMRFEYQQTLAYLGHKLGLKYRLSARENIGKITNDIMGLGRFYDVFLEDLSAGQKQRVALSRVLNGAAQVWLLDEPFTALDQDSVDRFSDALTQHIAEGGVAVVSSHQPLVLTDVALNTLSLNELCPC